MTDEMKPWQHGYSMEYLLDIQGFYDHYNTYSCSPFSAQKKHRIAASLKDGSHLIFEMDGNYDAMFNLKMAKVRTAIKMYGDVELGRKLPGDATVTNLAWAPGKERMALDALNAISAPAWLFVWAEDDTANDIAQQAGFRWVGSKVSTFAEIQAVYFREGEEDRLFPTRARLHPTRLPVEDLSLEKTNIPTAAIEQYRSDLLTRVDDKVVLEYTNHYSNYNKRNSWSALALRGYTDDPTFITKPEEIKNKKWNEEHKDVDFHLQDTELRAILTEAEGLISLLPGIPHRIRLMKLTAGGELSRHTDQVDPECGVTNGRLMRFHFPLDTNPGVIFTTWEVDGTQKDVHMEEGECYYIDVRKPHMAVNTGTTDRIHLVLDIEANDDVRSLVA